MPARPGAGRPSKGARRLLTTRPPLDLAEEVMAAAERQGLNWSDYIANVLAEKHGRACPTPPASSGGPATDDRLAVRPAAITGPGKAEDPAP